MTKGPVDPIAEYRRAEKAQRRLGKNAKCKCGETRPEVLSRLSGGYICEKCARKKIGRSEFDRHHPAGKSNCRLTIPIPANDHRARLSVEQYSWPPRTLQNRGRSPLLAVAACVRGFLDTVTYLMDGLLGWIPSTLEELDDKLTDLLGRQWWNRLSSQAPRSKR